MNQDAEFLRSKGWHTWYNEKYWVHPECVEDKTRMDYTNYGMTIEDAVKYEKLGKPKFAFFPLPYLSKMDMAIKTQGLNKKYEP